MRYLAARNPKNSRPITYVPMREKYDCLTCIIAMALNIAYEQARDGLGGNLNPDSLEGEEKKKRYIALCSLMEQYRCGSLHLVDLVQPVLGRRYWVEVQIDDPGNPLSQRISHSVVIDEAGRVLDPNPQHGVFKSLSDWSAAITLTHRIIFMSEFFDFTL